MADKLIASRTSGEDIVFKTNNGGTLTEVFRIAANGAVTNTGASLFGNGNAATPSISFSSDTNTGIYSVGADQVGVSTGGTLRKTISTTAETSTLPQLNQDGSASAPAYSFSGDTNTGIYRIGTDNLGFAAAGTKIGEYGTLGAWTFGPATGNDINHTFRGASSASGTTQVTISGAGASSNQQLSFLSNGVCTLDIATGNGLGGTTWFRTDNYTKVSGQLTTAGAWTLGPTAGSVTHTIQGGATILNLKGTASEAVLQVTSTGGSGSAASFTDSTSSSNGSAIGHIWGVSEFQVRCGSSGGVYLTNGSSSWASYSDVRLKKDIENLNYGLAELCELSPIKFRYLTDESDRTYRLGFKAQEVQGQIPEIVSESTDKENNTWLGLDTTSMIPILVKAIQEQQATIEALKSRIEVLESN